MAPKVEKVSVALPHAELAWAKRQAKQTRSSVSAVVAEALREAKRREALRDVLRWLGDGRPALTRAERAAVEREWKG